MADATRTIRTKFDGDASDLVRATRAAQRAVDQFGKNAGKSFITRFRAFITGENDPSTMGTTFGKIFGSGIVRGLAVPGFGPALASVLVPLAVAAATFAGEAMALGLVGGLGLGLTGLGIFFASKFKVVQDAWGATLEHMQIEMGHLSGVFAPVLVDIAEQVQTVFDTFIPSLRSAFETIAPSLGDFATNLLVALQELEPAIQPVADAFATMLDTIGPELPGIVSSIADAIIQIADTVAENPEAIAGFFSTLEFFALTALNAINLLAEGWAKAVTVFEFSGPALAETWNNFGQIIAGAAGIILTIIQNLGDSFLHLVENITGLLAKIPGPWQKGWQDIADSVSEAREDFNADMGGMIGDLEQWGTAMENAPKKLVLEADHSDLMQKLADAEARLAVAPKDKVVAITAEISGIQRAINITRLQLASLQGKTVYIDVITRRSTHINAGLRQHGGPVFGGQTYLVGEAGPELLSMPTGNGSGYVTPTRDANAVGSGDMQKQLTRAVAAGINGATLIIDDHGRGRLVSRTADLYARAG